MKRIRHSMVVGARDVSPMILGIVPWGLVAGAAVAETGAGVLEAIGMSVGVFAGAVVGSHLAARIDVRVLRLLFVGVLALTAAQMALRALA